MDGTLRRNHVQNGGKANPSGPVFPADRGDGEIGFCLLTKHLLPKIVMQTYSPRVQEFRASIIRELPRAPNDKASHASLEAMPIRRLIQAFVKWRIRLIPVKP